MVTQDDTDARILRRIEQGEELSGRPIRTQNDLETAFAEGARWDNYNSDLLRSLFGPSLFVKEYNDPGFSEASGTNFPDRTEHLRKEIRRKLNVLRSIRDRLDLVYTLETEDKPASNSVFLVHGHDVAQRESVARFLEKLGLIVIILQEKPAGGRTIIEQFEKHSRVGFAVVLLTADDVGAARSSPTDLRPRARQNVIFELGYLCGSLSRARVCALYEDNVELPSDFHGVVYIPLKLADWQVKLIKELRLAGMSINPDSLFE